MKEFIEGNLAREIEITSSKNEITKEEADKKLKEYSSVSKFDDDVWLIDKIGQDKNILDRDRRIIFKKFFGCNYKDELKLWAIILLLKRRSVKTIAKSVNDFSKINSYVNKELSSLKNVSESSLIMLHNNLFIDCYYRYNREIWQHMMLFFKDMKFNKPYRIMSKFVLEPQNYTSEKSRYIADELITKLDLRMKDENLPLAFQTVYWILRLIPNRITEVLSMTDKCLKQINENTYIISIPTFKQAGQYHKGSVKLIEIKYEGIGKFLIDLIKKQLEYVKNTEIENRGDFLFFAPTYNSTLGDDKKLVFKKIKEPSSLTVNRINSFLEKICKELDLKDEKGESIKITSHQFRHNAITDRMTSGIFRPIDIIGLTAHHNTQMIEKSYTHYTPDDLRIESKPILFNGKIINTDNPKQYEMILKRPFAFSIHGLGICSDVRGCDKNKFECYRCPYMIPDFNQLERYQMERDEFIKKKELSDNIGNKDFSELCSYWIESYEILIQRILKALSNEDLELEDE